MTGTDPTRQRPQPSDGAPPAAEAPLPSSAVERANRMSAANMLRSLLPLVVICLLIVGWQAFRSDPGDPVREIDPASTVRLASEHAGYALAAPTGLPDAYRPTSARTDAGHAADGASVTLEIGYVTPSEEFAGFATSDDLRARPIRSVLDGAKDEGTVEIDGKPWIRSTTERGETALSREADGVVVVVSGSAPDDELRAVAAAVRPAAG
jgi:hypothetical protein